MKRKKDRGNILRRLRTAGCDSEAPLLPSMSLGVFAFAVLLLAASSTQAAQRPNILFILADDLGWSDLECYGNPWFKTPHLNKLASEGTRYTNAYTPAPICSAARASFLTGKTTARLGFEFVVKNEERQTKPAPLQTPDFTPGLALKETTIPETLKEAGYDTAFFGKWHLNKHHQRYLGWSPTHGPKNHGFDVAEEDFGNHPYSYWGKKAERKFADVPKGKFLRDSMTDRAISYLNEQHQNPFFLMVSHFYVHTPIHTRSKWLYDSVLKRIPSDHPRREKLAHYGAMVETLDHHVGQLLGALDDAGHRKNTLVVFTSDNGGDPNYYGNAPLRGNKWNLYEGGVRVPFMARWPGKIPTGLSSSIPVIGYQLHATFAEVAETNPPTGIDGISILPALLNPKGNFQSQDFIWHFPYYHPERNFEKSQDTIGIDDGVTTKTRPMSAMRIGDHKVIYFHENKRTEIYDLSKDLSEQNNLYNDPSLRTSPLRFNVPVSLQHHNARLPEPNPSWPKK